MPIRAVAFTDSHNAFIEGMVEIGKHASPDGVVVTALERYREDIVSELALAVRIEAGEADMDVLRSFLDWHNSRHPALATPIAQELKARISILIGPIPDTNPTPEKPSQDGHMNEP